MEPFSLLVLFLGWIILCFFLARVGGWRQLARRYRSRERFEGKRILMQTLRMRWMVSYGNSVHFGANARGLHISMFLFFRPFHPPLFIPWGDVKVIFSTDPFGGRYVTLQCQGAPAAGLFLSEPLALQLAKHAGGAWPPLDTAVERAPEEPAEEHTPESLAGTESLAETERRRKAAMEEDLDRLLHRR